MPDYLANREAETGEPFVGIASDGKRWVVLALERGTLIRVKETILDPDRPTEFLAWLDGALALKSSLPPDALTIKAELGGDSVAFHYADSALRALWARLEVEKGRDPEAPTLAQLLKLVYGREVEKRLVMVPTYTSRRGSEMHRGRSATDEGGRSKTTSVGRGLQGGGH